MLYAEFVLLVFRLFLHHTISDLLSNNVKHNGDKSSCYITFTQFLLCLSIPFLFHFILKRYVFIFCVCCLLIGSGIVFIPIEATAILTICNKTVILTLLENKNFSLKLEGIYLIWCMISNVCSTSWPNHFPFHYLSFRTT